MTICTVFSLPKMPYVQHIYRCVCVCVCVVLANPDHNVWVRVTRKGVLISKGAGPEITVAAIDAGGVSVQVQNM